MTNSATIPCRNPRLCGVKNHRPGTDALCMQEKSGPQDRSTAFSTIPTLSAGQSTHDVEVTPEMRALFLDPEVDRLANGIVNEYESEEEREGFEDDLMARFTQLGADSDEEHWIAFNAAIANKEMPPRPKEDTAPFGNEHMKNTQFFGREAIRIDAGERGGYMIIEDDKDSDRNSAFAPGELIVLTDQETTFHSGDDGFFDTGAHVRMDQDGELYFESDENPGSRGAPIRIKDLQEGDTHWSQYEDDFGPDSQPGEWPRYEMMRRLYSNPVSRAFMESKAQVRPVEKYKTVPQSRRLY